MLLTILFSTLVVTLLGLLVLQYWAHHKTMSQLLEQQFLNLRESMQESRKTVQVLADLNEKAQALIASSDPLAFQQIQAMNQTLDYSGYQDYDPSDEAESDRIAKRNPNLSAGDDVDGQEARQLFAELTGADPEFYGN